jgi:hypothetical protein
MIHLSDDDDNDDKEEGNEPKHGKGRSYRPLERDVRDELDGVERRRKHQEADVRRDATDAVTEAQSRTTAEAEAQDGPFLSDVGGINERTLTTPMLEPPQSARIHDPFSASTEVVQSPRRRSARQIAPNPAHYG